MEKRAKFSIWYYLAVFALILLIQSLFFSGTADKEIPYNEFRDKLANNEIKSVVITKDKIHGLFKSPEDSSSAGAKESKPITPTPQKTPWHLPWNESKKQQALQFFVYRLQDNKLIGDLQAHGVEYRGKLQSNFFSNLLSNWIIPIGILMLIWGFIFRRMRAGQANFMQIGKSKAKIYTIDEKTRVTFDDVAGVDEAVEEVKEVVEFLKNPDKYTRLGAVLPKGVLLVGAPGTGKTLLARAVAGEAAVPFFSMSGTDFVEMFVGVGAARVRDLFAEAQAKAPCIIFIDEIDAIGKSRGQTIQLGGHDERENTLNQLLVEMDGFDAAKGLIIMGATNRPEVLDKALLRPGRFDRQVVLDRPDLKGRMDILKIYAKKLKFADDIDLRKIAAMTPGFAGADLANVVNEAALLASRKNKQKVDLSAFQEAIERMIAGLEKKNRLINPLERKIVAYHESGHAIVGHFTPGADPVQKVSIVPRGVAALGYTMQTPLEDRFLMSRSELLGKIEGLLGGRAAEELVFGEVSTGASNDLERVAQIANNMIKVYGMSRKVPNLSLVHQDSQVFLGQGPSIAHSSDKLEQTIDDEVFEIINVCYENAKKVLTKYRNKLEKMAESLLEKEVIDEKEIISILGSRKKTKSKKTGSKDENNRVEAERVDSAPDAFSAGAFGGGLSKNGEKLK